MDGFEDGWHSQCVARHRYLPWWSGQLQWAFDQLAVGSAEAMAAYASGYRTTVKSMVGSGRELYPEVCDLALSRSRVADSLLLRPVQAVMWEHLASVGGEPNMRSLHGFHASLARPRPSGHPFFDDPFGKASAQRHSPSRHATPHHATPLGRPGLGGQPLPCV